MAVSAIAGIGNFVSFIPPLARLQQITPQQAFGQVVDQALRGATIAPAALTSTNAGTQSVAAFEQALFGNWLTTLQNLQVPSAPATSFDQLLAAQIDLTSVLAGGSSPAPFGLGAGAATGLTPGIVSLFDTMQLLGSQANQQQQVGTLIDLLA